MGFSVGFALMALFSALAAGLSAFVAWRSRPNRLSAAFVEVAERMDECEAKMASLGKQWTREQAELGTLSEAIAADVDRARKIRARASAAQSKVDRADGQGQVETMPLDQIEDPDRRMAEATRRARSIGLHA